MPDDLRDQFHAFELLDDDEPMRGFKCVVQCELRDWERLYAHEAFGFEQPFDVRFAKAMVKTLSHVVCTDQSSQFGFGEHQGFSLLLEDEDHREESSRQVLCRIASNAAAKLSLLLGDLSLFDARFFQFPSPELARSYFVWRQRCHRQLSLDRHVLHVLTSNGRSQEEAEEILADFGGDEKQEILDQNSISFAELPPWQRNGAGCFWNRASREETPTLTVDTTLPEPDAYADYLRKLF